MTILLHLEVSREKRLIGELIIQGQQACILLLHTHTIFFSSAVCAEEVFNVAHPHEFANECCHHSNLFAVYTHIVVFLHFYIEAGARCTSNSDCNDPGFCSKEQGVCSDGGEKFL
jgi:hypothetical protein